VSRRIVIEAFVAEFRRYRRLSEEALMQVGDADLYTKLNPTQNSIAAIVQQMHDSLISRWPIFLNDDGEATQIRDREDVVHVERGLARATLMGFWHLGWKRVFDTLASLCDDDLTRIVRVGNGFHTMAAVIARQLAHHAWHASQIALLARHVAGDEWRYLTFPPEHPAASGQSLGHELTSVEANLQ
jgi:hypothetical protein